MNFGERLRSLRKDVDYSLRKMADELGISFSALGKYERNEHQPDFDTLEKIAEYFGVSIDWLLGRTDIKTYDEKVFFNDVNHLANKLTTMEPEKRRIVVNIIDQIYLIIHSHIDDKDTKSLVVIKQIISQLHSLDNGIEKSNFQRLLGVEVSADAIDFLSKHKNEINLLLDDLFKIYLEKKSSQSTITNSKHVSNDEFF
ncbi:MULTISPECIES: helix-turn-helix domain-containing protein [unclassified Lysinibacillus]|uniref:helix-turn-helix domain-containing protein n=1 Tax=unclassified Lysinibacillus TaxID=2636778 RepID=UPI0037F72E56